MASSNLKTPFTPIAGTPSGKGVEIHEVLSEKTPGDGSSGSKGKIKSPLMQNLMSEPPHKVGKGGP